MSDSPQIVGSDVTAGFGRGRPQGDGEDPPEGPQINVVYAINEPAADGGYAALKAAGKEKGVLVVAVDGGCPGVKSVKEGVIGATSQQYPLLMASDGVEAVAEFIKTGKKPAQHRHRRAAGDRSSGSGRSLDRHRPKARSSAGVDFGAV